MEGQQTSSPPADEGPMPPKKGKTGLWVAIAVVVIAIALIGLYFAGVFSPASSADLPQAVDLAVIATPAATVPRIIAQCGAMRIPPAVVIPAGVSEIGPEGARLAGELLAAAHRHGVRVMGPNCIGLMRLPLGLNATFARGHGLPGTLALVSQSGAVCTAMVDWATSNGVGFSSVISLDEVPERLPRIGEGGEIRTVAVF